MFHANFNKLKLDRGSSVPMILIVYLFFIFACVLSPFTFSLDSSLSLSSLYDEKFDTHSVFWSIPAWDVFSNILLFVPFGFLFVALPVFSRCNLATKILLSAVATSVLSFAIESLQMFLPRAPSLVDIFLNTVGGMTGALLANYVYVPLSRTAQRYWLTVQRSPWLSLLVTVYIIVLVATSILPLPLSSNFSNWDPEFTFQLGNEATYGRPWLGKVFLVAIYDRALSPEEVSTNFIAGSFPDSKPNRIHEGLVVFYDFREGSGSIIYDHSTFGRPLDLLIHDTGYVKWLSPNGIEFLGNTIVTHSKSPNKLYSGNIIRKSELTLEVWISPTHVHQSGPARIVSYSQDTGLRNFTLGQDEKNIVFRLRTPLSGLNGTSPQLQTKDDPLTTDLQHLVVTYRGELETLYVNGQEHETTLLNKKKYPFEMLGELFGWKYKWSYMFLVIFPVGFLSYILFSRNRDHTGNPVFLSTLIGLVVMGVIEGLQVVALEREVDLFVLPVGTVVILLSSLTSAILSKNVRIS